MRVYYGMFYLGLILVSGTYRAVFSVGDPDLVHAISGALGLLAGMAWAAAMQGAES